MMKKKSITISKRRNTIIIILSTTLLLGIVGVWFYFNIYSKKYNKPDFERSYTQGQVSVDEQYGYSEMKVSDAFKVGACGAPTANADGVDLYFSNPEGNDVWLKCVLLDSAGSTVGESGVIKPNSYIKTVKFDQPKPAGDYDLTIKVLGFEPETYYSKGVVNLKTKINIA